MRGWGREFGLKEHEVHKVSKACAGEICAARVGRGEEIAEIDIWDQTMPGLVGCGKDFRHYLSDRSHSGL